MLHKHFARYCKTPYSLLQVFQFLYERVFFLDIRKYHIIIEASLDNTSNHVVVYLERSKPVKIYMVWVNYMMVARIYIAG